MSFWNHGREPFAVWAPERHRVRLLCGDNVGGTVVEMAKADDGWWSPAEPLPPAANDAYTDYGYILDDDFRDHPDPRSRRQPGGVHERSRDLRPVLVRVDRRRVDRTTARRAR